MRHPVLLIVATLMAIGTVNCGKKKDALPVKDGVVDAPYQEFGKTSLFFYVAEKIRWKLDSEYLRKPLADTAKMLVVPVKLTFYDSLGDGKTIVLADSGYTTSALHSFTVWGDVYIRTRDSLVIRTEKLWWIKDEHKVESDTYVQIETPKGDIMRGKGLDASEDFSRTTFKSNVSGKFPDFKRRLETEDTTGGVF
jgi:LPS export ABC transporter protein LptC